MSASQKDLNKNTEKSTLYEIRSIGVSGDVLKVIEYVTNEFTVSKQTAKKMIEPGTLLVYHLTKSEAEKSVNVYCSNGLLCKAEKMKL